MIFFIIFFLAMLYVIFGQYTLIKECVLYPNLVFMFYIILSSIISNYHREVVSSNSFWKDLTVYISIVLGLILYYIAVKKINKSIGKIDIYIYIYILLNSYMIFALPGGVVFKGKGLYWSLFTIAFYFINIIYFYYFRKDRLLKIVIMPTLVPVLNLLPMVLGYILLYWNK